MVCKVSRGNRYIDIDSDSELEEYEADLEEDAQEVGYVSEPTAGILDQVNYYYVFYLFFRCILLTYIESTNVNKEISLLLPFAPCHTQFSFYRYSSLFK